MNKRTASDFVIIYSLCFLHWWCVTTISQKVLSTLLNHKYFSVNNSYFCVPIIDKCWLECCLSTQSWYGTIWKYHINPDGFELTSTVVRECSLNWAQADKFAVWSHKKKRGIRSVVLLYRWGSTGPLHPGAAGSSPPPPHSDGRCCKALLYET